MKAITTRYSGPTATRGARIIVRAEGVPALHHSYDHAAHDAHESALSAFLAKRGPSWGTRAEWHSGTLPDGVTRVWVLTAPCAECHGAREIDTGIGMLACSSCA